MIKLNLDHPQDSKGSAQTAGPDGKWAQIGTALIFVAVGISVAFTLWTEDYEGLGLAGVRLSLMTYFAYRAVRGFLGTGIARCTAGILLLGVVAFAFIPNCIARYHNERELERFKRIAMKHNAELIAMGRELAATLEQCQLDDVYSLFGGRDEITPPKLVDLRLRTDTALKSLKAYQSQFEIRMQAMKSEAFASGDTESVRAFVTGVDRGQSGSYPKSVITVQWAAAVGRSSDRLLQ
jgi:hypothetical protein